jgi:hypothetical protein
MSCSYVLASLAVTDDVPSLSAVDPPLEKLRPRPVDGGKVSTVASQSSNQSAREPAVAEVTSLP